MSVDLFEAIAGRAGRCDSCSVPRGAETASGAIRGLGQICGYSGQSWPGAAGLAGWASQSGPGEGSGVPRESLAGGWVLPEQ